MKNKSYTINNADGSVVSINFSYEERMGVDYEKLEETLEKVIDAKYNHEYLGSIVKIIYAIYEDFKGFYMGICHMHDLEVKIFDKDKNLIEKVKCSDGTPTEYSLYGKSDVDTGSRKYDIEFINGNFSILDVTDESFNHDNLSLRYNKCRGLFEMFLHRIRSCEYHPVNEFGRFSNYELVEMKYISSIYTKFIGESVDFSKKGVGDTLYNILTILTSLIDEYQQEFHLWPALKEYTDKLWKQIFREPYLTRGEHIDYIVNRWVLSEEEELKFENNYYWENLEKRTDYDTIKLIGELIRNSSKIANLSIEETLRFLALAYRGCSEDDIPKEYHNFIEQLMMEIDGILSQRYTINRGKH